MNYNVTIFGIHLKLSPIAFTIPIGKGHWDIYWYGIIIATGFLLALIYGLKNAGRYNLNPDRMLDVILVTTPIAILSARAYYVIFDGEKLNGIGDFFGFGTSSGFAGLAIYGGVIGAFVSGALMCKLRKIKILDMFDVAAAGFLIGQGIGRWGNFVNQEAYGAFTGSSWVCRAKKQFPKWARDLSTRAFYMNPYGVSRDFLFLIISVKNAASAVKFHLCTVFGTASAEGLSSF